MESKIDLCDRLRNQGVWPQASLWKDAKVKELRASGMDRATAKEEAWKLMEAAFPAPPPPPPEKPDEADAAASGDDDNSEADQDEPLDIENLMDRIDGLLEEPSDPLGIVLDLLICYFRQGREASAAFRPRLRDWADQHLEVFKFTTEDLDRFEALVARLGKVFYAG